MPIPFWQAAERAERALERVLVECECPICDTTVKCVVNGTDVTVPSCKPACTTGDWRGWRYDQIAEHALSIAAARRADLTEHYRGGAYA